MRRPLSLEILKYWTRALKLKLSYVRGTLKKIGVEIEDGVFLDILDQSFQIFT